LKHDGDGDILNRFLTEINIPDKIYREIMALKNYFSSFECIAMDSFWLNVGTSSVKYDYLVYKHKS